MIILIMIKVWKSCFSCVHMKTFTYRGVRNDRCMYKGLVHHELISVCRIDERKCGIDARFYREDISKKTR